MLFLWLVGGWAKHPPPFSLQRFWVPLVATPHKVAIVTTPPRHLGREGRNIMKSTSRMLGGFKARDTRRRNELRCKAFAYFTKQAIALGRYLPTIGHCKEPNISHSRAGWYLTLDVGNGYNQLRFETWAEAMDWLISLAPHC